MLRFRLVILASKNGQPLPGVTCHLVTQAGVVGYGVTSSSGSTSIEIRVAPEQVASLKIMAFQLSEALDHPLVLEHETRTCYEVAMALDSAIPEGGIVKVTKIRWVDLPSLP